MHPYVAHLGEAGLGFAAEPAQDAAAICAHAWQLIVGEAILLMHVLQERGEPHRLRSKILLERRLIPRLADQNPCAASRVITSASGDPAHES